MHLHLRWAILASVILGFVSAGKADAVCLNQCRNHCIGTCSCIAHREPDCNCNVFQCNCDCCKITFCSGTGTCYCQSSSAAATAAAPAIPICNCGSPCCKGAEAGTPPEQPAERFARIDTSHDGTISFEEMVEYLRGHAELNTLLRAFTAEELRAKYLTPLDKNGNERLEPEEFDRDLAVAKPAVSDKEGSVPSRPDE